MALILSLETSTNVCSVALHQNGNLLGSTEILIQKSHSQILTIICQNIVEHCGFTMKDVDAFAVSSGPGSYTGLRIGVSTAKGFCYALEKPLISVNTLDAMAFAVNEVNYRKSLLCPMIDARRMEVYTNLLEASGEVLRPTFAAVIDDTFLKEELLAREILFFGNGAAKCRNILGWSENAVFLNNILPSAKTIGQIAEGKFNSTAFEDVIYFEPFYLKEFNSNMKGI